MVIERLCWETESISQKGTSTCTVGVRPSTRSVRPLDAVNINYCNTVQFIDVHQEMKLASLCNVVYDDDERRQTTKLSKWADTTSFLWLPAVPGARRMHCA